MNQLREFARSEGFRAFLDRLFQFPGLDELTQGVVLDFDRFWLQSWWARNIPPLFTPSSLGGLPARRFWKVYFGFLPSLNYRPDGWEAHCRNLAYPENAGPIRIKIVLSISPKGPESRRFPAELPREWEGHPVRYEYRPPCIGLSSRARLVPFMGGTSVGPIASGRSGTAGGLLTGRAPYLVSCAHVLGEPETPIQHPALGDRWLDRWVVRPFRAVPARIVAALSPNATPQVSGGEYSSLRRPLARLSPTQTIATVRFSRRPIPRPGLKCNRIAQSDAADVDLAVAEIHPDMPVSGSIRLLGPVQRITTVAEMTPGDDVVFVGKESDLVEAQVGALCVWYSIAIDGVPHCFRDLFEITPRPPWYLNRSLASPGDSGAWVCGMTEGVIAWDGMLIGGDGARAYCCFAENILRECQARFPDGLALAT